MRLLKRLKDHVKLIMRERGSFRDRILFSTIGIIVVITFAVLFLVNYLVTVEVRSDISERLVRTKKVFEEFERSQYQKLLSECKVIGEHPSLKDVLITNNPLLFAEEAERYQRLIDAELFVLLSSSGAMVKVVDQPYRYARELFTPELRTQALSGEEFVVTVARLDKIFQLAFIPIHRDDEVLGALSVGQEIGDEFVKAVKNVTKSEVTLIIEGRVIASTLSGEKADELSSYLAELPQSDLAEGDFSKFELNLAGERFLSLAVPLGNEMSEEAAYCIIQQSIDLPLKFLRQIRIWLLGISLFAVIIAFVVTFFISKSLATPLNQLVTGAKRIAADDLEYEISVPRCKEMGLLARTFNEMRLALKKHLSKLKELNQKLAERVNEISTIHRVTRLITASLEEHKVFRTVLSETKKFTRVDAALLGLVGKDGKRITIVSLSPRSWRGINRGKKLDLSETLLGKVVADGELLALSSLDPGSPYVDERALTHLGLVSAALFPLFLKMDKGAIFLVGRKKGRYSPVELRMLSQIASQLSLTLNNIFLYERLRESEEKYRRLFQSVKDAVYRADGEGRCMMINQAGAEIFGFDSSDQMVGLKFSQFYASKDDLGGFADELRAKGYVTGFRARMRRRDGQEIYIEASGVLIKGKKGRIVGTEGVIRDVTHRVKLERELAESEAFLRRVIENTSDAIFTLDLNGNFSFVNTRFLKITGSSVEDIIGTPFTFFFSEEVQGKAKEIFAICTEEGSPVINEEAEIVGSTGERITVLISLAPLISDRGVYGVVGTASDITDRKRLEAKLIQSERLASMGEVAAGVAHEINNPLGIVLGFAQDLLSETPGEDPHYRYLKIIEQETARCAKVVRDLLNLTHSRSLNLRKVKIKEVIEQSLSLLRLKLRDGNIRLTKEIPRNIPPVEVDPEQMKQVFVNIVLNAIQAMSGGGNLHIRIGVNGDRGGDYFLMIEVADTGCGIKEEDVKKVFEPFYTTSESRGTGLGLTVCRRIIEAHRGKIELKSREGKGTDCIITLPFSQG